jgi:hypothetical protein
VGTGYVPSSFGAALAFRPVGARFPRVWYVPAADRPAQRAEQVRVFPRGARFPRLTAAEEQAYLAAPAHTSGPDLPIGRPVGARFPRWS